MKKLKSNSFIILATFLLSLNSFAKNSLTNSIDTSEISVSTITDISKIGGNITLDYVNNNKDVAGIISMAIGGGVMVVGSVAALPALAASTAVMGGFFIAVIGIDFFKQNQDEKVKIVLVDPNVDLGDIELFKEEINEINRCSKEACNLLEQVKNDYDIQKLPNSNRNILELLKICYERMLLIIKVDGDLSRLSNMKDVIASNTQAAQAEYRKKVISGEISDPEALTNNYYKDFFEDKLYTLLVNTKVLLN